jgi:hypothetical protein
LPHGYFTFMRIVVCLAGGCIAAISFRDGKSCGKGRVIGV